MTSTPREGERFLDGVIAQAESNNLEFKRAEHSYNLDKAISYCAAIANERGGYFVLGVTDQIPREVLGTAAFADMQEAEYRIFAALQIKVRVREVYYRGVRVLVFLIPGRRDAQPIAFDGRYLMRAGESLVAMPAHTFAAIFAEQKEDAEDRVVAGGSLRAMSADCSTWMNCTRGCRTRHSPQRRAALRSWTLTELLQQDAEVALPRLRKWFAATF